MPSVTPNLWFDTQSQEAAEFYVSVFPNSRIVAVTHYGPDQPRAEGMVLTVEFELDGQRMVAINGGPEFTFSEAISLEIRCADQAEIDHYWDALTADGGEEGPCGWCKDRFGLSWQVVPQRLLDVLTGPDPAATNRAMQAMLQMRRLDVAALDAAARG